MDKTLYEFPVTIYGNLEKYNEVLSKARCRIFYKYENRNGTYISDEFAPFHHVFYYLFIHFIIYLLLHLFFSSRLSLSSLLIGPVSPLMVSVPLSCLSSRGLCHPFL